MNDDQLRTLFRLDRPFRREGTAGEQGSGLGLIVCREMLEKHGTTLHIESVEGKGSRFWFELRKSLPFQPMKVILIFSLSRRMIRRIKKTKHS